MKALPAPGGRVFSYNVQGREFKDFDIWAKTGGPNRAYIETVPVEVTNGEFRITFTSQVQNPEINAIEIIPQTTGQDQRGGPGGGQCYRHMESPVQYAARSPEYTTWRLSTGRERR